MQHGTTEQVKKGIDEIKRVLKPKGHIFITLSGRYSEGKIRPFLVKTARKIEDRVYVPTQGSEAGLPHFIYNKELILKHYHNFTILNLWKDAKDYYCFIGQKT